MELYLILICLGFISGILTILFGFAGGFVIVPLVYSIITYQFPVDSLAYNMAFKSAIATSLLLMLVNSGLATYQKYNILKREYLFPLSYWIGFGSVIGVFISLHLSANILKYLFIIYLTITIFDSLLRQLKHTALYLTQSRLLNKAEHIFGGILIGSVASALGVGGSVMTVPLFRHCGLSMNTSVALANPLSFPVAFFGCLTYTVSQMINPEDLGSLFIGYFYYPALIFLVISSFLGMKVASIWIGGISNRIHEYGYIFLLICVLIIIVYR